jgi:hypothetical protein
MPCCSALIFYQRTSLNVYDPDIAKCSGQMRRLLVIDIGNLRGINL